jgi:hypothetical protein
MRRELERIAGVHEVTVSEASRRCLWFGVEVAAQLERSSRLRELVDAYSPEGLSL